MQQKSPLVKIGDFFFRYRNFVFPVILVILFAVFMPSHEIFGREWLEDVSDWIGALMVFAGLALRAAVVGFAYIKRGGLNKQVYADTLVTEGFFNLSRNPLYFANMLIYSGIFVTDGNLWVMAIGIGSFWFIYESIIAAEEYFLKGKFGPEYEKYCQTVPKWIPNFRKFRVATQGMQFNYKKVIVKDYSTFASSAIALLFLNANEALRWEGFAANKNFIYSCGAGLVLILLFSLTIRILKKTGVLTV